MGALIVVVFLSLMSFGIFIWYFIAWNLTIRGDSLLTSAARIQPLTVGGTFAAILAAWLIPRLPAQYILAIGSGSILLANLLLATMPAHQIYWRAQFFAVILSAFSPDLIFTASQIIASNSVKRHEQGIAGSLIGTLFTYGMSTGLGFGGTVEVHTNHSGTDIVRGYRSALYLGVGFAAASLVLCLLFVRIKKDEREGWDEPENSGQPMVVSSETTTLSGMVAPKDEAKV
jgi:hypothetical protein